VVSLPVAVVTCLRKFATYSGRATRAEYWWFNLFCTPLGWFGNPLLLIVILLPTLAVGSRRLHDVGFPGFLVFAPFLSVPILWFAIWVDVVFIVYLAEAVLRATNCTLLILSVFPSQPETNAYGLNPHEIVETKD